jgi:hypothetical protein
MVRRNSQNPGTSMASSELCRLRYTLLIDQSSLTRGASSADNRNKCYFAYNRKDLDQWLSDPTPIGVNKDQSAHNPEKKRSVIMVA